MYDIVCSVCGPCERVLVTCESVANWSRARYHLFVSNVSKFQSKFLDTNAMEGTRKCNLQHSRMHRIESPFWPPAVV